jgi:hypothetical protein
MIAPWAIASVGERQPILPRRPSRYFGPSSLSARWVRLRSNAPFAELVRLSRTSIADEMREVHSRRILGE